MPPQGRRIREETLSSVGAGATARIESIRTDAPTRRQLHSMGLLEGTSVRVLRKAPLGGAILVAVGRAQYALGRDVAARIRVSTG